MLPKSKRLGTKAFTEIMEKGRSFHNPFLILKVIPSLSESVFALSVPKKVSKLAVDRNKIKRQIYSIIEDIDYKPGYKIVLIIKVGFDKLSFKDLQVEIQKTFVKSALLK